MQEWKVQGRKMRNWKYCRQLDKIVTLGVTLSCHLAHSHYTADVCKAANFHTCALCHIRTSLDWRRDYCL